MSWTQFLQDSISTTIDGVIEYKTQDRPEQTPPVVVSPVQPPAAVSESLKLNGLLTSQPAQIGAIVLGSLLLGGLVYKALK